MIDPDGSLFVFPDVSTGAIYTKQDSASFVLTGCFREEAGASIAFRRLWTASASDSNSSRGT